MYRDNIIKKHYTAAADFVTDLWSELEAMGWTLEDNQDASSYRVYSSNGEDGVHLKGYVKIVWTTSAIQMYAYVYWDSTNHTGYGQTYTYKSMTINDTDFYGWIYGSKDFFYLMSLISTTYYHIFAGYMNPFFETPRTTIQADATSGDNVTLIVDSTTGFVAGTTYQIVDAGTGYRMQATVGSITDATHLVIDHLSYNVTTGAVIAPIPILFGIGQNYQLFITCTWIKQGNGNCGSSDSLYLAYPFINQFAYIDPDQRIQRDILQPIVGLEYNNVAFGGYSDTYFLEAPRGAQEDVFYVGEQDSGTSTGSNDSTHLNDTGKSWTASAFAGKVLIITSGPGVGEIHKISDNTSTQITIVDSFNTIPDNTSTYVVADEAYRLLAHTTYRFAAKEGV